MKIVIIISINIIVVIIAVFGIVFIMYIHADLTELNELIQINAYFLFCFLIARVHIRKIKQLLTAV